MGYIAKLTRGTAEIDLSATPYALMQGFVPPSTNESANYSSGTSANRHGGSSVVSKRATNMSFSFAVRVLGSSTAETEYSVRAVKAFLSRIDGAVDKTYFEWKSDDNYSYEPIFGQFGAFLRCEVVNAMVSKSSLYSVYNIREKAQIFSVNLVLKPYAMGIKQIVGTGKGGLIEDWIGAPDGVSRGLQIPEVSGTGGNLHENPIFGHSTWNNHWVDDAGVTDTENNDPAYLLFGQSSAKLVATADDEYTESLTLTNLADYTLSYYVKKPDGSQVAAADTNVHYDGSNEWTTYTSIGDGWYRISATVTGDGAAGKVGIRVKADRVVYLDGAQCELKDYVTPFFYGDMMGCSWSGAAHSTSSARVVALVKWDGSEVYSQEWTARIVWKADKASTAIGADITFLHDAANVKLHYDDGNNRWEFTDGANTATGADTFAIGDLVVLHITQGKTGGLIIYRDGTSKGSESTYTPIATPTSIWLGSNSTPAQHTNGTYLGFATFDREMTATEVDADYDEITEWVNQETTGKRLEAIPWLWTKDGDDVVDNCNDSTHDNYCVISGVPGSTEAKTDYFMTTSSNITAMGRVYLSRLDMGYDDFGLVTGYLWDEHQDTPDGSASGGEYQQTGITTVAAIEQSYTLDSNFTHNLMNKEFYTIWRLKDDTGGANYTVYQEYNFGGAYVTGDTATYALSANYRLYLLPPVSMPSSIDILFEYPYINTLGATVVRVGGARSTGTSNIRSDYFNIMPRPFVSFGDDIFTSLATLLVLSENLGIVCSGNFNTFEDNIPVLGDIVNVLPNKLNLLQVLMGSETTTAPITDTLTFTNIYVIPRFEIM